MRNGNNILKNYDNIMCCLGASVFTDIHHGSAISVSEFEYLKKLKEIYCQEVNEAREIISSDASFGSLSYEEKVVYCVELLKKLRIRNHGNLNIEAEFVEKDDSEQYVDINDYLDTIPQEDGVLEGNTFAGIELDDEEIVHKR